MARQLEPEAEEESSGPIRRRIKSLTIKLEPFETSLTNQEAINVRNVIESFLKKYFFEVQPWAVQEDSSEIVESLSSDADNSNRNSIHDATDYRASASDTAPEGSVTYVGLAQILDNKLTEGGVELTMNGLVYFAEGSKDIPDEMELLQMMETQALGDSEAVVQALKDYFPQQQQLIVTVKSPLTEAPPTELPPRIEEGTIGVPETIDTPWADEPATQSQSDQGLLVGVTNESPKSPLNSGVIGGGAAVAVLALVALVGLLVVRRRRYRKGENVKESLVPVMTSSSDNDDLENGFHGTAQDDWKPNSNSRMATETVTLPRPSNNARFLSTVFHRKSPVAEQHLDMVNSAEPVRKSIPDDTYDNIQNNNDPNMSNFEFTDDGLSDFDDVVSIQPHMLNLQSLESFEEQHTNMTHNEIIVQKDMLGSSFEEAPASGLLGEIDVGESQPPLTASITASASASTPVNKLLLSNTLTGATAASGGDLSYSSSSTSSAIHDNLLLLQKNSFGGSVNEQQELEESKQEDQRIRYSMMPNPYVHNRATVHGRQKVAEAAVKDRSAPCVLQSTDFTASSLARGRKADNISDTGSSHSLGMVPKLMAQTWWPGNSGHPAKSSSAAATEAAYLSDDLAYSGDEENTFGVPESDGWDPADAELSSMGDAPTQEMMNELDFHMGLVVNPNSSVANSTTPKKSRKQEPPGTSPRGKKYEEPSGISPMRSIKRISPPSSGNIEAAKSILQKIKKPPSDVSNTSVDSIETAKFILNKLKSSPDRPERYHRDENNDGRYGNSDGRFHLGESIAAILDSDASAENEISFNLDDTMEI